MPKQGIAALEIGLVIAGLITGMVIGVVLFSQTKYVEVPTDMTKPEMVDEVLTNYDYVDDVFYTDRGDFNVDDCRREMGLASNTYYRCAIGSIDWSGTGDIRAWCYCWEALPNTPSYD